MSPSSRGVEAHGVFPDGKTREHPETPLTHLEDNMLRCATPETLGRGSFSSVREHATGLAQTFTSSKVSSYAHEGHDDAISDDSTDVEMGEPEYLPPLTHPHSKLHGAWYPVGTFKGWKGIRVKGRHASRSFSDLQALNPFRLHPDDGRIHKAPKVTPMAPGASALEKLPTEILSAILRLLVVDTPTNGLTKRNSDLMALLLTSQTVHNVTLSILYRHVTIPHSRIFRKFLNQVTEHPDLGAMVRRLDFNHFNPNATFITEAERAMTHNLTGETLEKCLSLTPRLQEFLAQEHIGENLERGVLHKLFFELRYLKAVDFCSCTHTDFVRGMEALLLDFGPEMINIPRLSFHKNVTLPASVFETIFPRLGRVTHLDVALCRITAAALFSIPLTTRITHLNLAKCRLPGAVVVKFLCTHPAVKDTLQVLNLGTDAAVHEMLSAEDVAELLPHLPKTLRSLSLRGSNMTSAHIPLLLPLTRRLEELALGRSVTMADIDRLLQPDEELGPHSLRFIDMSDFQLSHTSNELFDSRYCILKKSSAPLHVVEVAERVFKRMDQSKNALKNRGWALQESGQRYWMVRSEAPREDPNRPWKMGAESWGARKIPVAVDEVGGWYGYQMFYKK